MPASVCSTPLLELSIILAASAAMSICQSHLLRFKVQSFHVIQNQWWVTLVTLAVSCMLKMLLFYMTHNKLMCSPWIATIFFNIKKNLSSSFLDKIVQQNLLFLRKVVRLSGEKSYLIYCILWVFWSSTLLLPLIFAGIIVSQWQRGTVIIVTWNKMKHLFQLGNH